MEVVLNRFDKYFYEGGGSHIPNQTTPKSQVQNTKQEHHSERSEESRDYKQPK